MFARHEEATFTAYKKNPASASLSSLLNLHQDRAFNLCYQILRNREDAEDAAQEALVKAVECLPRIDSATTFRSWLYRICVTHALNLSRGIQRRRTHESRYAMQTKSTASAAEFEEAERRTALFEALRRLKDEQRDLLVKHYFEKTHLEHLASHDGVSKSAVWKKIVAARQSLKETLASVGMAALVPDPTSILEACQPASLSTNLVPGVMAKVTPSSIGTTHDVTSELCKGSLTSATKVLALGGIVMTAKQSTWTTVAITTAILLGLGVVIGLMFRTPGTPQGTGINRPALQGPGTKGSRSIPANESERPVASAEPAPGARTDPPSAVTSLKNILAVYRKKLDEKFPDRAIMRKRYRALWGAHVDVEDEAALQYWRGLDGWRNQQLSGLRDLVLSEPSSFLEFFQSPEAAGYLEDMLSAIFRSTRSSTMMEYSALPAVLRDGFLTLLQTGSGEQKTAILSFTGDLDNMPREFADLARTLMFDADTEVQWAAIVQRKDKRPYTEAEAGGLRLLAQSTSNSALASEAVWALARCGTPGFEDFAFSLAASASSNMGGITAAFQMLLSECTKSTSSRAYEQRVMNAICQWQNVRRWDDKHIQSYSHFLLGYSWLPMVNSLPVYFDQAANQAQSGELANRLRAVASAIRSGNTDERALNGLLNGKTPEPEPEGFSGEP